MQVGTRLRSSLSLDRLLTYSILSRSKRHSNAMPRSIETVCVELCFRVYFFHGRLAKSVLPCREMLLRHVVAYVAVLLQQVADILRASMLMQVGTRLRSSLSLDRLSFWQAVSQRCATIVMHTLSFKCLRVLAYLRDAAV